MPTKKALKEKARRVGENDVLRALSNCGVLIEYATAAQGPLRLNNMSRIRLIGLGTCDEIYSSMMHLMIDNIVIKVVNCLEEIGRRGFTFNALAGPSAEAWCHDHDNHGDSNSTVSNRNVLTLHIVFQPLSN